MQHNMLRVYCVEYIILAQILTMNEVVSVILEILKYTIPSGIVFATAYFLLRKFFEEQHKIELLKLKSQPVAKADLTVTRLQAYERLILLLERIEPSQMVPRIHRPGVSASVFLRDLKQTIREEYEHNLTQQIYVSSTSWNKLDESRNAVNQLIDLAYQKVGEAGTGVQLSSVLFEILSRAGVSPTADAIETLKAEARQLL